MSHDDAVERVAKAMFMVDGDFSDAFDGQIEDFYIIAAAAITEYNAYLRKRAQQGDVVEAFGMVVTSRDDSDDDAMLGKENHDELH